MNIEEKLQQAVANIVEQLYNSNIEAKNIQVNVTRKDQNGDYTVVVFPLLKISKKSPDATGQEIGQALVETVSEVAQFEVIKVFLNLTLSKEYWAGVLVTAAANADYGFNHATSDAPLVMIEYSSPNTNKPLHLGHIRNNLLGFSLSRLIEVNGNRVVKTNIVNDRGIHICKSMLAWLKWGNGCTPKSLNQKGDHLVGDYYVKFDKEYKAELKQLKERGLSDEEAEEKSLLMQEARQMLVKWEAGDKEVRDLWETMNSWVYAGFDETYKMMGVSFDKIYYESQTYLKGKAKVEEGLAKGLFERHDDGSVWADLTGEGLDQKLLLRSDGTSVYMTQDIGTAEMRYEDYPIDKMIYVVGNEQNYHFQVLSILLDRLGFKWGRELTHFSYGMVELPNGKMKSREGTVVDADDLMALMVEDAYRTSMELGKFDDMTEEERREIARIVGMGALKYFILKVDARKNMLFNPEESIDFNGNTGPFIQYTYARIRSILRKAGDNAQCTMHNAQSPMRNAQCTMHNAQCTMHNAQSPMHNAESPMHNAESPMHNAQSPMVDDAQPHCALSIVNCALNEKEVELIQKMNEYGAAVEQAGKDFSPSGIANYCYELTKVFNQFYHDYSILNEPDEKKRAVRLVLASNVAKIIRSGMSLLGIEVPERM